MATGLFNLKQVNQAISQGAWSGYIAPRWVEYLVVAGGGSGGGNQSGGSGGGGGGAGGLLTGIVTVTSGTSYTVTVGSGGTGSRNIGVTGNNSVFGSITSNGGGGAGAGSNASNNAGLNGGSGGGGGGNGGTYNKGGLGIAGQGNAGGDANNIAYAAPDYPAGGGGGAGTPALPVPSASLATNGGSGIASSISGSVVTYAGGGGGSTYNSGGTPGAGGVGGGGAGTNQGGINGSSGGNNTGGGGGGAWTGNAGNGGSGIVVVRYPGNVQFYTGGTVTYSNGYIVHNFTANGTLAPTTPTVVSEYQISRSLRFNQPDSAYLNRTPASAGNRKTWTWSAWVKRSLLGTTQQIFSSRPSGSPYALIYFANEQLTYADTSLTLTTTQVFRDASAWYHIVIAIDTTQATASDRLKFYVNGVQVTAFGTATYPAQNYETQINTASQHNLSGMQPYGAEYFSGYMTEVNFIDGQSLPATSFGYVNPTTGVWTPAKYVGAYGTNGFYLNFSNNSNTTAATLGADSSGNGNNWTPNNFSVTAGIGNDSFTDTPTSYGTDTGAGGTVRGNYATLDPLQCSATYVTLSNGNLQYVDTTAGGSFQAGYSTMYATSGKYYFETTIAAVSGTPYPLVGSTSPPVSINSYIEKTATGYQGYGYLNDGTKATNDGYTAFGAAYTAGDTVSVAVDIDAGKVWFAKNGTWQASGDPATGANPAFNIVTGRPYGFAVQNGSSATSIQADCNFGQRPWLYTAPSGFKALCTQNLPTPTIGATSATLAGKFFNPVLYTGNGGTQSVTGVGFQPDFTWVKRRDGVTDHQISNAITGAGYSLHSNTTGAEDNYTAYFTGFTSDGFNLAGGTLGYNVTSGTFVAWNWKANGAGSSNTAGSITSTVSASTTSGFSVATFTKTATTSETIGHGLGVAPSMIIVKARAAAGFADWAVWHTSIGIGNYIVLSSSAAVASSSTIWNNTNPTSTVFSMGTAWTSTVSMVAYCFAPVAGYSAFGSYTGNGSASEGPFIYTGFRPAYVMVKVTTAANVWLILDATRNTSNVVTLNLNADQSAAENTFSGWCDFTSNGFKIRNGSDGAINTGSGTYIYMAFAQNPFKYSLAR